MFINNIHLTYLICKDAYIQNNYINIIKEKPKKVKGFLLKKYLNCPRYIVKVLCMTYAMYNFYKYFSIANRRDA